MNFDISYAVSFLSTKRRKTKKIRELIAKLSHECAQVVSGVTKVKDTARVEFPSVLNGCSQRK